jgi:hypothetical protein
MAEVLRAIRYWIKRETILDPQLLVLPGILGLGGGIVLLVIAIKDVIRSIF